METARIVLPGDGTGYLEPGGKGAERERIPIGFEKVHIHPLNEAGAEAIRGCYLTNNSQRTIPVCDCDVLEGDVKIGSARIEQTDPWRRFLIPLKADPNVRVEVLDDTCDERASARIVGRTMSITHQRTHRTPYAITNETPKNLPVLIEHPFDSSRRIVEPVEFEERTCELWRFRFHVYKRSKRTVAIVEEETASQSVDLVDTPADDLNVWASDARISEPVRAVLSEVMRMKGGGDEKKLRDYLETLKVT